MGVPMVPRQHRLHPHSEWSSMRSGAKDFGLFYEGLSAVTAVANLWDISLLSKIFPQLD